MPINNIKMYFHWSFSAKNFYLTQIFTKHMWYFFFIIIIIWKKVEYQNRSFSSWDVKMLKLLKNGPLLR